LEDEERLGRKGYSKAGYLKAVAWVGKGKASQTLRIR
jgi:hypothetical protein